MEYWSVDKKGINPLTITPTLQYSNTPKLIQIETGHDGLPSFGYRSVDFLFWTVLCYHFRRTVLPLLMSPPDTSLASNLSSVMATISISLIFKPGTKKR